MKIGQKVRVGPVYIPWKKRFNRKVGVISKIREVHPSKNVPDGKIYTVSFQLYNRKTGEIGIEESFSKKELLVLDEVE